MADNIKDSPLLQEVVNRTLYGGPEAKMSAKPEPSFHRKALELMTGYPADPEQEMGPGNALQMLLTGLGIGKAAQIGVRALRDVPDALPGEISRDPFGLAEGPVSRRQFLDKAMGNTTKRGHMESRRLHGLADRDYKWKEQTAADAFDKHFNTKFGWPNPVINPELMDSPLYSQPGPPTLVGQVLDRFIKSVKGQ